MKPTPAATLKCTQNLTAKEVFALTLQHQLELWQSKPLTFSEAEIQRILGFDRCPEEGRAYNRWREMWKQVHFIAGETRRMMMEATWRVSMESHWMFNQTQRMNRKDDRRHDPTLEELARLKEHSEFARTMISHIARQELLLEAFGGLHGVDLMYMTRREREILAHTIKMYNHVLIWFEDDLAYLEFREEKPEDHYTAQLPAPLTLTPPDIPTSPTADLMLAIETCTRQEECEKVLAAFDIPMRG